MIQDFKFSIFPTHKNLSFLITLACTHLSIFPSAFNFNHKIIKASHS